MTQLALHADALAELTTHHVASIAAAFEHVVATGVPALREPRPRDIAHAVRTVELVAETIAGFAIGVVTGELVRGVRTWFGDEPARAVRVIAASAPARRVFGIAPARFLDERIRQSNGGFGAGLKEAARRRTAAGANVM